MINRGVKQAALPTRRDSSTGRAPLQRHHTRDTRTTGVRDALPLPNTNFKHHDSSRHSTYRPDCRTARTGHRQGGRGIPRTPTTSRHIASPRIRHQGHRSDLRSQRTTGSLHQELRSHQQGDTTTGPHHRDRRSPRPSTLRCKAFLNSQNSRNILKLNLYGTNQD